MDEEFHERKDRVARDPGQSSQEPGPVLLAFKLWANLQRKRGSSHGVFELPYPWGRIRGVSRLGSIVVVSCRC